MHDEELRERARKATIAARGAQEQLEDEWSVYRSLARMRMEVCRRVQQAPGKETTDVEAHKEYAALLPRIEAQRQVLHQAMADLEKSETELRAAPRCRVREPGRRVRSSQSEPTVPAATV